MNRGLSANTTLVSPDKLQVDIIKRYNKGVLPVSEWPEMLSVLDMASEGTMCPFCWKRSKRVYRSRYQIKYIKRFRVTYARGCTQNVISAAPIFVGYDDE